jgi:hypothetical protein
MKELYFQKRLSRGFISWLLLSLFGLHGCVSPTTEVISVEPLIQQQIQNQISQIPKGSKYEENVLDSLAITLHIKGVGYKVAFHPANRDEYQAFFDESGRWLSLNHLFTGFTQVRQQTYVLENTAATPRLLIFDRKKLKKTLTLPANPQKRSVAEMIEHPEFGDNYGFSEEFANRFAQISKNLLPIYYQPDKDLASLKVLLIDTNKNEFLNFDLPIAEVIPLRNNRFLVYQRHEAEDTFFLSYCYVVDRDLNITDHLEEINSYLKAHPNGFESFKYYLRSGEVKLSLTPPSNKKNLDQEKIFTVK